MDEVVVAGAGSVYAKIAQIMGELKPVPKSGYNTFQNYAYVKGSDLADAVRPLLSKFGLALVPTVVLAETIAAKTSGGKDGTLATVTIDFILGDESGGEVKSRWVGQAHDTGDKALYKAYSGAVKYFYIQTFSIGSEDDPELDATKGQGNNNNRGPQGQQGQRPPNGSKGGGNAPPTQNKAPQGQQGQRPPNGPTGGGNTPPVQNKAPQGQPPAQNQAPQGQGTPPPATQQGTLDIFPFKGLVKLTSEPAICKKPTPNGLMDNVTIGAMTRQGQVVVIEGWGVEMIEHLADLTIDQVLNIKDAKARTAPSGSLRIRVEPNNFEVQGAA